MNQLIIGRLVGRRHNEDQHITSDYNLLTHFLKFGKDSRLFQKSILRNNRQSGQGNVSENSARDLRAELLAAEAVHFAKSNETTADGTSAISPAPKRALEAPSSEDNGEDADAEAKRRKILEESRDIDADSGSSASDSSEDEDSEDDEEDETAELMRELEKIKRERAEKKAQEVYHLFALDVSIKLTPVGCRESRPGAGTEGT